MKRIGFISMLLAAVMAIFHGCQEAPLEEVKISLNKSLLVLEKGQTEKLSPTITPSSAAVDLTWSSADNSVAKVSTDGDVTGVAAGETVITVSAGEAKATCKVTVKPTLVEEVVLDRESAEMTIGDKLTLKASVLPADADDVAVSWKSLKEEVASVDSKGNVEALMEGSATIVASAGGKNAQCVITVKKPVVHVESVKITKSVSKIVEGESFVFEAVVTPADATDKSLTWESSDKAVLSIAADGKASALKPGKVEVVVRTTDGSKTDKCSVEVESAYVPVTKVEILEVSGVLNLKKGDTHTFAAKVYPEDATDKTIIWSVSDEKVITVDQIGKVTAVGGGKAKVTVTSKNEGKTAECEVSVVVPVKDVLLSKTSAELTEGEELELTVTVNPSDATNKNVIWSSSNEDVAKVVNGKVTAMKAGVAKITVTTEDGGKKAECAVTVVARIYPVTGITLDKASVELTEGDELQLVATVTPSNATNKNVTWSSSDETVAKVVGGKVTALKTGVAKITVTTSDGGKTASCDVTVKPRVVNVTSVEISSSPANLSMLVGDEFTFAAKVLPENATDKSVAWKSSATNVISIDGTGKAKALAPGQAVITVTSTDGGKSASVTVKVSSPVVDVTSIEITSKPSSNKMTVGDSFTFTATVKPDNATDKTVKWSSSNTSVLSIDPSTGKATAKAAGNSTITVKSADEKVKSSVSINVVPSEPTGKVTSLTLSTENSAEFVRHGKTLQIIPSYSPAGAYPASSKWYSSDPKLATIDESGLVRAVSFDYSQKHLYYSQNGYPEVTFTHVADNIQAIIKIKILPAVPEKILVSNPPPASMTIGQSWDFGQISILPEEAEQSVQIICTYDGDYGGALGKTFQANKVGNMAVLITANGEHAQTVHTGTDINYNIRVEPKYETAVNLSRASHTLQEGSLFSLTAEITPSDATFSDLSWSSSNTSVATVSNGVVRAVSPGTAEISARTHHGKIAKCSVTVTAKASAVSIGDYYYSDGTTSSELIAGKTPLGVVFALADPAGSDPAVMGKEHPGVNHGLVVGLESYNTPISVTAFIEDMPLMKVSDNAKASGMIDMMNRDALCGYSNTKAMKTWGKWVILDVCNSMSSKYALPSSASGWYIPSLGEIELLGDAYSVVNEKLGVVKAEFKIDYAHEFWCSTFFGVSQNSYTYKISQGDLTANVSSGVMTGAAQISSTSKYVRYIFAF